MLARLRHHLRLSLFVLFHDVLSFRFLIHGLCFHRLPIIGGAVRSVSFLHG